LSRALVGDHKRPAYAEQFQLNVEGILQDVIGEVDLGHISDQRHR
jgi:hypothetical protein